MRQNEDNRQRGLRVEVRNGDVNFALRKFKKKVQEDGILQELREREAFEKPSVTRAKAKKAGIARWKKKQAQMNGDITTISGNKRKR